MQQEIKEFNSEYNKIAKPAWDKFLDTYNSLIIQTLTKQPTLTTTEIYKFETTWLLNDKKSKKIIDTAYKKYKTTIKSIEHRAKMLKKKYPSEIKNHK